VAKVNPANTSRRCAKYGCVVNNLKLIDRQFPKCGWEADGDYNTSLNILDVGLGQSRRPVEREPLHCVISYMEVITGKVLSVKQEAP